MPWARGVRIVARMDSDEKDTSGSGTGIAMGIALGLPLGAAIGMLVFDNIALGAGIGMLVGIVAWSIAGLWKKP